MNTIQNLQDLLLHIILELQSAENELMQLMPSIIDKANHRSLKNALQHHHHQTEEQLARLKKIVDLLSNTGNITSVEAKGIKGFAEEANELLNNTIAAEAIDVAIIYAVQKMEHYEICAYGTAMAFANQLHENEIANLLLETLEEEYAADDLLTALATSAYNKEATTGENEQGENADEMNDGGSTGNIPGGKVRINERTVNAPGGRAGTSHRRYSNGESRGH